MSHRANPSKFAGPLLLSVIAFAGIRPAYFEPPIVAEAAGPAVSALTPPAAALQANGVPGSGIHALGYVPNPSVQRVARLASNVPSSLPATVDLSQYDPPVGDQGGVLSCVSWATGYYLRGWYARRDGYYPAGGSEGTGSYSPMYLYSQLVQGQNVGTKFGDNLNLLQQGIDTRADYSQGDYDYRDLPTADEAVNAGHVKISAYTNLGGPDLRAWIETTMAAGNPVVLGIPIYPEFDHATAATPLVNSPTASEVSRGGHAVFASKYDANGVWIENQWGTGWGLNGWAELSWSFINQYAYEGVSETPMVPGSSVPGVVGLTSSAAGAKIRATGLTVAVTSAVDHSCNYIGRVMAERPGAGTWENLGSTVTITLGNRPTTPCP